MPSRNEIVPLDSAMSAMESSEADTSTRPGPEVETLPTPQKLKTPTFGSKAKATSAEMASVQDRRMMLVRAQQTQTAFQLFYGLFGVFLMMVQMEYLWFSNTRNLPATCPLEATSQCPLCFEALGTESVPVKEGRMVLLALRVLITCSTALMLYYVYHYYAAECEVMKLKNIMPPKATLLSSSLSRTFIFEMLVLSVHPFPAIENVDPKWPQLTVATSLVMFTRVVLVLRVVQCRNSFNTSNGWFIGALTNVDFTAKFFMKSTLKNHPAGCLIASFATLGFVAGYSLYISERFMCAFKADSCCEPMSIGDALWMLIVTILTIGYGDVVPRTTLGRSIAVSAGIFGTLSTAVTIAVMSNYLVLTRSEHKVNAFLKKDENRRLINEHAARALQAFAQLRAAQRRHHNAGTTGGDSGPTIDDDNKSNGTSFTKRALRRAELKLFTVLSKYRQVKRRVHSHDVSDPIDSQMTMLEMMEVNVEYIRTKIEELSELFVAQTGNRMRKRKLSNTMPAPIPDQLTNTPQMNGGNSLSFLQQPTLPQQPSPQQLENVRSPIKPFATEATCTNTAENIPAWATALELTFQSLLEQVSRVSGEVEAMKARIESHSESIENRLVNLEKRLVVSDALFEMSKARGSSRNLLRRESKSDLNSSNDGRAPVSTHSPPRLRRTNTLISLRQRPSIHDFVTPSELREYQKPDEEDDS